MNRENEVPKGAVIRCASAEVGRSTIAWLLANRPDVRLVLIEGMRGAGKSWLLRHMDGYWPGPIAPLNLDELIPRGSLKHSEEWVDGILRFGGQAAITELLGRPGLAIIDGPGVGLLMPRVTIPQSIAPVRVYIKELYRVGGVLDWWAARQEYIIPIHQEQFFYTLDRHHLDDRPDLDADLVIERISDNENE